MLLTYAYQWRTCDSAGNNCSDITGATNSTYTLQSADVGKTIRVVVTATDSQGSASATSTPTAVVATQTPSGQTRYSSAVLGDTPTGFWQLGDAGPSTARDSSGNAYDLSWTGSGVTAGVSGAGPMSGASGMTFSGGYLQRPYFANNNNFAIEFWARSNQVNEREAPVANGWVGTDNCWHGVWAWAQGTSLTGYDANTCYAGGQTPASTVFSDQTSWHYVVVQRVSGATSLWVDGVQKAGTDSTVITLNGGEFSVGGLYRGDPTNSFGPFKGALSDVAYYTHTLGAAQIANHYNAALGPSNTAAPTISGSPADGQTLTAAPGTWTGASSYAYQWQSCDSAGNNCQNIAGATSITYVLGPGDIGTTLRVVVTAANSAGSRQATSQATAVVQAQSPQSTSAPTVSGSAVDGQTLTASHGSWTGTSLSYAYQWQSCDSAGSNCQDITGATSSTHTLAAGDVGTSERVVVTASNSAGSTDAASQPTSAVQAQAPQNTAVPTVSGTATDGHSLTASHGTWTGTSPSYAYQWQRCDTQGANCQDIPAATSSTYDLSRDDVDATVRVVVTASNSAGSAQAASDPTSVIQALPPENTTAPSISGTATEGQTLTASPGTWSGTSPALTYHWQSCDPQGGNCADIQAATGPTYTLGDGDLGTALRVVVTATNSGGTADATSQPTSAVATDAPTNTTPPSISGTAIEGETLTADPGQWDPPPADVTYQWQSCDAQGSNCADVEDATDATYDLDAGDVGATLRVTVTVTGDAGSQATAVSTPSVVIAHEPPSISGDAKQGETLTASPGSWDQTPTGFHYQWRRCDSLGENCNDIAGARASHYVATAADVGATLRVAVAVAYTNGTNDSNESPATYTVDAAAAPANLTAPMIGGQIAAGGVASVDPGEWTDADSYAYQWQSCDLAGGACTDLPGATMSIYLVGSSDVGRTLRVVVRASGIAGDTTAASDPSSVVTTESAPVNTDAPSITGETTQGRSLVAYAGSWSGAVDDISYQWQRCDQQGANCADITGATGTSYVLDQADIGATLRLVSTAGAEGGASTPAVSLATNVVAPAPPPQNTTAPAVTGDAAEGSALTAHAGTWVDAEGGYAYQWQRCDPQGRNCTSIQDATAQTYVLAADDVDTTVRLVVTATGLGGSTAADSAPTAQIISVDPPQNTALPVVWGEPTVGGMLNTDGGSWSGADTLAYQWQRCDAQGQGCVDIASATWSSYYSQVADVASTIRVVVTATGPNGSASATSDPTMPIAEAAAPTNTAPPAISGTTNLNGRVDGTWGSWTGGSLSYSAQWERCDGNGSSCSDITGQTDTTYAHLQSADVGSTLRFRVSAQNSRGTATAVSDPSAVITALQPVNTSPPTVSGDAFPGGELWADPGTWTNQPNTAAEYQWQRCDAAGENCADVTDATLPWYDLGPGDAGASVRVLVSYTGREGPVAGPSAPVAIDQAPVPSFPYPPTISGDARDGATLSVDDSSWPSGDPYEVTENWQRCDAAGSDCTDITDATDWSYTLSPDDVGHTVRFAMTATGYGGTGASASQPTTVVQAADTSPPPTNLSPPVIGGQASSGNSLSLTSAGDWSPSGVDYSYQWQRCDQAGQDCRDIAGATSDSYELATADIDQTVRVIVTGTDSGGSTQAASTATSVVGPPANPVDLLPPALQGSAVEGHVLSLSIGFWQNALNPSYHVEWQRCDEAGDNCDTLPLNDDEYTYKLVAADVGATIQAKVTVTTQDGSSTATTHNSAAVTPAPPPENSTAPTIQGDTSVGATLSADAGSWNDADGGLSYQWQSCDTHGQNCADIASATSPDYPLGPGDLGARLRVVVTATGIGGTASVTSDASDIVADPAAPDATVDPAITGGTRAGETLTADHGAWTGAGISYSYQWQSCESDGQHCVDLDGADGATYTPDGGDVGATIRVEVTASNVHGATTATSAATNPVEQSPAPTNTIAPNVSGDARAGETLSADPGTWTNAPSGYDYQWQRCDASGSNCTDIGDATEPTYDASADDGGSTLRVDVTAYTSGGQDNAQSPATATVVSAGNSGVTPGDDKLVFSDGNDLYTADTSGDNATRITDCKVAFDIDCGWRVPAISPDGHRIAASMNGLLALMNIDGSDRRYLAYDRLSAPAWAPDGKTIAYAANDGTAYGSRIYTIGTSDNASPKPLAGGPAYQTDPDYSPDGAQLVYVGSSDTPAGSTLYVANADGTNLVSLEVGPLRPSRPRFSPDGSEIVFSVDSFDHDPATYAINTDGSDLRRLASNSNAAVTTWTPDGSTVLYQVDRFICGPHSSDLCDAVPGCPPALAARPRACHIWGMHPDGSDNHPLPIETNTGKSLDATYRKPTRPTLRITGGVHDGDYITGSDAPRVSISARDRGSGIRHVQILDSNGDAVASSYSQCADGCPIVWDSTLAFSTGQLSEGQHSFTLEAENADGITSTRALTFSVDLTAPPAPSRFDLTYDPDAAIASISWDGAGDPALADGTEGSGFGRYDYRYQVNGGDWSSWDSGAGGGFDIPAAIGDVVLVEATTTDAAGNTSPVSQGQVEVQLDGDSETGTASGQETQTLLAATAPDVLAPSSPAAADGQVLDPTLDQPLVSSGELDVAGGLATGTIATTAADGFSLDANWGRLQITPLDVAGNASDASVVNDAAIFANTAPGADTVIRPTALGIATYTQIRERSAPQTYSWRVDLSGGQHLKTLSDGGVAIIASTKPMVDSSSDPNVADVAASAPDASSTDPAGGADQAASSLGDPTDTGTGIAQSTDDGLAPTQASDTQAQLSGSKAELASAAAETPGWLVAVVQPPVATDAAGNRIPTTLQANGDTITLTVDHVDAQATYPVLADPHWTLCRTVNPCGHYDQFEAAAYAWKWRDSRNDAYFDYKDDDCTNYMSQIINAGGFHFMRYPDHGEGSWFWHTKVSASGFIVRPDPSASWIRADALVNHLLHYGLAIQSHNGFRRGDLVAWKWDGAQEAKWDHVNFVDYVSSGKPYFLQHSHDYHLAEPLDYVRQRARHEGHPRPYYIVLRPIHTRANIP